LGVAKLLIQHETSPPQSNALQVALGVNRSEVFGPSFGERCRRLQEPLDQSMETEAKGEEASEPPLHRAVKKTQCRQ